MPEVSEDGFIHYIQKPRKPRTRKPRSQPLTAKQREFIEKRCKEAVMGLMVIIYCEQHNIQLPKPEA